MVYKTNAFYQQSFWLFRRKLRRSISENFPRDIKDTNNDHIEYASVAPKRMFNKEGEPYKMSRIFKSDTEKKMNELSLKMVAFLMK
tara:strand:+ start:61 stop:318 length:258 start_codon:yes stop_codon:yes gene_type:complete